MNPWTIFWIGVLVGWLVEWLIDRNYWRRKVQAGTNAIQQNTVKLDAARQKNIKLNAELESARQNSAELKAAQQRNAELKAELESARQNSADLTTAQQKNAELKTELESARQNSADLTTAQQEIAKLKAELDNCGEVQIDPLEKIKGIGSVIKRKLNENGIFSFAQLATLTPQRVEEILGDSIRRLANEEEIIRQAVEFAKQG